MKGTKSVYRCHDCGMDFSSEEDLGAHHTETHGQSPDPLRLRIRLEAGERVEFVGYLLDRVLGHGQNGIVFLAHTKAGKPVAIKMMLREKSTTLDETRFRREMGQMIELPHENIVAIYEANPSHNPPYIVMEYCELGSVHKRVGSPPRRLAFGVAAPIMTDALAGLSYMHGLRSVHRDIKPQNLFLAGNPERPVTKIADLGFAKYVLETPEKHGTRTGPHYETLAFTAPEALKDFKRLTPASDVWALGATFYYLLIGQPPRDLPENMSLREAENTVPSRHAVPIRERRPEIPIAWAGVIDKSLAQEPAQRYADAIEMQKEFLRAAPVDPG